jgi:hypothetical protein
VSGSASARGARGYSSGLPAQRTSARIAHLRGLKPDTMRQVSAPQGFQVCQRPPTRLLSAKHADEAVQVVVHEVRLDAAHHEERARFGELQHLDADRPRRPSPAPSNRRTTTELQANKGRPAPHGVVSAL